MDAQKRREAVSRATLLASVFSFVLMLASLFPGLIRSDEATFTWKGVVWLFIHQPGYWFVTLFAVATPLLVNRLTRYYTKQVSDLDQEKNRQQQRMHDIRKFVQRLGNEEFDAALQQDGDQDILGHALLELRDVLRSNRDNSIKLKAAEDQRKWTVEGLARISEILRKNLHDPDQLAFQVVMELTRSIGAVQGGFYLVNDTDGHNRFFEQKASFAYDRRKFADQKISWGDGLIGTCALEQKLVHLKNIPEGYISVTSGLGETRPDNLVLVPMVFEGEVYGVMEFASLHAFEQVHTDLLEKAAESVASTLSAVKSSMQTSRLLEESKAQTQILTSHEEEMRQNMEELQATQEEAFRQTQRFQELEAGIDRNCIRAEISIDGHILSVNALFVTLLELSADQIPNGKLLEEYISDSSRKVYREALKSLVKKHEPFTGTLRHTTRSGNDVWTMSSLTVMKSETDQEDRILWLAMDATPETVRNQQGHVVRELAEKWDILFELDINGNFVHVNLPFQKILQVSEDALKATTLFDMIAPIELDTFNRTWENLLSGTACNGQFHLKPAADKDYWISGSFGVIYSRSKEVSRILFSGYHASHEKQLEQENREQADILKRQEKLLHDAEKELASKLKETKAEMSVQLKAVERLKGIHEAINEEAPAGIVATGPDNRIIFFNRIAEKIWSRKRESVLDQDVSVLFPDALIDHNEIIASFTRPGDFKITGKTTRLSLPDDTGAERQVALLLTRNRIDNENTFTAYLLPIE